MKFSVATNFDNDLVQKLKQWPVADLFGKQTSDFVGGGRASYMLSHVSRRRLKSHIDAAHEAGIGFNYLLNAACLDNREHSRGGQKAIRRLLDELTELRVDSITVALPYLLNLIKRCYPQFKVRISVFAQIDDVAKAKWWADQGADVITLDSQGVNREFKTLEAIRKAVPIELQLMVNNHCLIRCPMANYHMVTLAHSSQAKHSSGGFMVDHCFLKCTTQKLKQPVDYLRADWIRPEDLHYYEELGYDSFKIVERNAPTDVLVNRVTAYASRRYDGNLLDLVQPFGYQKNLSPKMNARSGLFWSWRMLAGLSTLKPGFLKRLRALAAQRGWLQGLSTAPVVVSNRALDGFIDRFLEQGCHDIDCEKCLYCHRWAEKSVSIDAEFRDRAVRDGDAILAELESGKCWWG